MTSSLVPGSFLAEKYRVERVLGQGGMGIVVAATHLQLQQQVAIKMLLPEIAGDKKLVARFLQEGRSQVRIQGEHVVRVLDVGTLPCGAPFMVMELLAGSDLATVAETRGALPVHEAIDYVLQATEALAQAHSLGIVHRDLKPQNMFLTSRPDGSPLVKVLDFGISKNELRSDATRPAANTTEGGLLGSPAYMSPEQIRNPKDASARSDIWSLGVILYELLTGRMPFEAMSLGGLLAAITRDPPVDIRRHRADLPHQIAEVVMRCLSVDPEERPQDTAELALALALDAAGHARATRIAQIVRRFSVQAPAFAETALAATMLAGDATLRPGEVTMFAERPASAALEATIAAQSAAPDSSSSFEGSSTVHRVELPMSGLSARKALAFVGGVAAIAIAVVGVNFAMVRAHAAAPVGAAAAVVAPVAVVAPAAVGAGAGASAGASAGAGAGAGAGAASAEPGTGTGTGTAATVVAVASAGPSAAASGRPAGRGRARGHAAAAKAEAVAGAAAAVPVAPAVAVTDVLDTRK